MIPGVRLPSSNVGDFIMDEKLSIRRKATYSDGLSFSLLPYNNPQFTCNSDANFVNREANLYFFKFVLFRPYLASAWLNNKRKT